MDKTPKRDLKILMGDLKAKVGADNTNRELIMGRHDTGEQNENGELFTEFGLVIGGTIFPHKTTWTSPDGKTVNQIDHIIIRQKQRRSLHNVRVKCRADAASDHHLVVAVLKTKLKAYNSRAERTPYKFNMLSLKEIAKTEEFQLELLSQLPEETIEEQ
ncbi:craniofacial development protein 2-like [Montipora foliosa]|uniref:craniofacial development protein 2-like n=1 Tax=Montipora foliosa TaxID=591990 RepID=UPI0035F18FBF